MNSQSSFVLLTFSLSCYIKGMLHYLFLVVCSIAVQQLGNTSRCQVHSPRACSGVHFIQLSSGSLVVCNLFVALSDYYTFGEGGAGECNWPDGQGGKGMVRLHTSVCKYYACAV